jgi:hypothetical protein
VEKFFHHGRTRFLAFARVCKIPPNGGHPSKCEVRKLSANIRTSAVVVVRLLLYNRTTHYHFERGPSAETISAPTKGIEPLGHHPTQLHTAPPQRNSFELMDLMLKRIASLALQAIALLGKLVALPSSCHYDRVGPQRMTG